MGIPYGSKNVPFLPGSTEPSRKFSLVRPITSEPNTKVLHIIQELEVLILPELPVPAVSISATQRSYALLFTDILKQPLLYEVPIIFTSQVRQDVGHDTKRGRSERVLHIERNGVVRNLILSESPGRDQLLFNRFFPPP